MDWTGNRNRKWNGELNGKWNGNTDSFLGGTNLVANWQCSWRDTHKLSWYRHTDSFLEGTFLEAHTIFLGGTQNIPWDTLTAFVYVSSRRCIQEGIFKHISLHFPFSFPSRKLSACLQESCQFSYFIFHSVFHSILLSIFWSSPPFSNNLCCVEYDPCLDIFKGLTHSIKFYLPCLSQKVLFRPFILHLPIRSSMLSRHPRLTFLYWVGITIGLFRYPRDIFVYDLLNFPMINFPSGISFISTHRQFFYWTLYKKERKC